MCAMDLFDNYDLTRITGKGTALTPRSTGIGPPIVRRIIESHGGKCWVESDGSGKGTTFKFTLPGVPEEPPDPSQSVLVFTQGTSPQIPSFINGDN